MAISLDKIASEAPELLSLVKGATNALSLRKLTNHVAKVALVLDYSGSMAHDYKNGSMQRLTEKALALATQFDDDGAIDLFLFDTTALYLGEVTLQDFRGSLQRLIADRKMGTTNYADAFEIVQEHYGFNQPTPTESKGLLGGLFGKKTAPTPVRPDPLSTPANEPVYAIFVTDGAPNNKQAAIQSLVKASYAPIFWQFISIGSESISFLEQLDDLSGRYIDNADYKPVKNIDTLSDNELWDILLDEYPAWVEEERRRGQIR